GSHAGQKIYPVVCHSCQLTFLRCPVLKITSYFTKQSKLTRKRVGDTQSAVESQAYSSRVYFYFLRNRRASRIGSIVICFVRYFSSDTNDHAYFHVRFKFTFTGGHP